jgi:large subunit ribosomal protein L25
MAKSKSPIQQTLAARKRDINGKRPVRRLRAEGEVPGVVYGREMKPLSVTVNTRELSRLLHSARGENALVTLKLEDDAKWEKPVLVKSVDHHPVNGHVLHVDFHAIVLTERLKVKVPVQLKGEPVGVKQEGGILEHFLREVEVECLPTEIPAHIEFDVSAMTIGETIHVRDLQAPPNAKITSDADGVIASVQKPKEEKPEEAAEAVTEPEVLREKKEEEGAEAKPGEAKAEKPAKGGGEARGEAKKES